MNGVDQAQRREAAASARCASARCASDADAALRRVCYPPASDAFKSSLTPGYYARSSYTMRAFTIVMVFGAP